MSQVAAAVSPTAPASSPQPSTDEAQFQRKVSDKVRRYFRRSAGSPSAASAASDDAKLQLQPSLSPQPQQQLPYQPRIKRPNTASQPAAASVASAAVQQPEGTASKARLSRSSSDGRFAVMPTAAEAMEAAPNTDAAAQAGGLSSRRPSAAGLHLETHHLATIPSSNLGALSVDSATPTPTHPEGRSSSNGRAAQASPVSGAARAAATHFKAALPQPLQRKLAAPKTPHPFKPSSGGDGATSVGMGPAPLARRGSSASAARRSISIAAPAQVQAVQGALPVTPSFHPSAPEAIRAPPSAQPLTAPSLPTRSNSGSEGEASASAAATGIVEPGSHVQSGASSAYTLKLQRPCLKIRAVTWNHGSSVPKGDLEVLLGRVGEYVPPEAGWDESGDEEEEEEEGSSGDAGKPKRKRGKGVAGQEDIARADRIPPLPYDDAHPYHLIVIAGQECPWGDGKRLATGVGMAGELSDLARSKSKAVKERREREREEKESSKSSSTPFTAAATAETKGDALQSAKFQPSLGATSLEFPFGIQQPDVFSAGTGLGSSVATAVPSTPGGVPQTPGGGLNAAGASFPIFGGWGIGGKGWSDMCEDWLCRGPVAQLSAVKPVQLSIVQAPTAAASRDASPSMTPDAEFTRSPEGSRSTSPLPGVVRDLPKLKLKTDINGGFSKGGAAKSPVVRQPPVALGINGAVLGPADVSPSKRSALASQVAASRDSLAVPAPKLQRRRSGSSNVAAAEEQQQPVTPTTPSEWGQIRPPTLPSTEEAEHHHHHHHHLLSGLGLGTHDADGTPHQLRPKGLGPYFLLNKERCQNMYLAVYVFRGAADRVRGFSRGHVKSGLLAGRVGNKGAVGISLQIGVTRILLINAHLAAHEGKLAERLANVAKIKAELKLNTFLPPEDPRCSYDDITDVFDHTFWMGDLNFRVDITRKHADWLLMQKRYDQALEFDQLRRVMRETDAFRGFKEAPITFPPTFKYDVMKTLKQKPDGQLQRRRTVRQRILNRSEGGGGGSKTNDLILELDGKGGASISPPGPVASDDVMAGSDAGSQSSRRSARRGHRRPFSADDSSSSVSSLLDTNAGPSQSTSLSNGEASSSGGSKGPSEISPISPTTAERNATLAQNTAAAAETPLISHKTAIKAKRRLRDIVGKVKGHREETGPSPAPRRKDTSVTPSPATPIDMPARSPFAFNGLRLSEEDEHKQQQQQTTLLVRQNSIRPSVSSPQLAGRLSLDRGSRSSIESQVLGPASADSTTDAQPESLGTIIRRRTHRRRSSAGDAAVPSSIGTDASCGAPTTGCTQAEIEVEVQKYDTSAKQRTPSWCDRVLWRSTVVVAPPPEKLATIEESRTSRMSTAISHALLLPQLRQATLRKEEQRHDSTPSVTFAPPPAVPERKPSLRPLPTDTAADSPSSERAPSLLKGVSAAATVAPTARRWWNKRTDRMPRTRTLDGTSKTRGSAIPATSMARAASAVDLPSQLQRRGTGDSEGDIARPSISARRSSIGQGQAVKLVASPTDVTPSAAPPRLVIRGENSPEGVSPGTVASGGSPAAQRSFFRTASTDASTSSGTPLNAAAPALQPSNAGTRRTSWWADHIGVHLPSFSRSGFTPFSLLRANETPAHVEPEPELVGPKRGEVEILLYTALDDRAMRILEGRSDHRPVVCVAAIGV